MAFLYLRDHPFDEAVARIRSGIQKLNRANGVADGPMLGYHETVTLAWATIVRSTIEVHGAPLTFDHFAAQHPHLLAKSLLRTYYSPERIFSPQAKAHFIEPDLVPLLRIASQRR
jgi:hypothetical protein